MHMFMPSWLCVVSTAYQPNPLSTLQREDDFQIIFDCMNRNCLFHFTANLWQMFWKDLHSLNVEPYPLPSHNMTVYYVYTAMIHSHIILISFRTIQNIPSTVSFNLPLFVSWIVFRSTFINISKVIGHSLHFVTSVYVGSRVLRYFFVNPQSLAVSLIILGLLGLILRFSIFLSLTYFIFNCIYNCMFSCHDYLCFSFTPSNNMHWKCTSTKHAWRGQNIHIICIIYS